MLKLYAWVTPNGHKPVIMLEELQVPYELIPINLGSGAQRDPSFKKLNPNGKIPVIIDTEGPTGETVIFESGAILIYLAEKFGKFLPREGAKRYQTIEWLMFQMASVGPMFGQALHFSQSAQEKIPYAIDRFNHEVTHILETLELGLETREFLASDYSIADIATFPWVRRAEKAGISLANYPRLLKWKETIAARPAVVKAYAIRF